MQYQKRNLLTIALASALAIAFASGCDDKPTGTTTGTNGGTTPQTQTAKVHEWLEVKSLANLPGGAAGNNFNLIEVSGDDGFLYVTGPVAGLSVADLSDIDKLKDNATWTPKTFNPSLGGGAGKLDAAFTGGNTARIVRFAPTSKGALISVDIGGAAAPGGGSAALLVGKDYKAAWQTAAGAGTHINDAVANGKALYAGVLQKTDKSEFVYIAVKSAADTPAANSTFATPIDAAGTSVAQKLNVNFRAATAFDTTQTAPWFVSAGGKAIVVRFEQGVSVFANTDTDVGTNTQLPNAGGNAGAARFANAAGAATSIVDVETVGGKVYIAMNNGVTIFDPATGDIVAATADASWTGSTVLQLAVDKANSKIYAVLTDGLYECTDGKKAAAKFGSIAKPATLTANVEYDEDSKMPNANIMDARFTKGHLIIATSDKGLFVRKAAVAKPIK